MDVRFLDQLYSTGKHLKKTSWRGEKKTKPPTPLYKSLQEAAGLERSSKWQCWQPVFHSLPHSGKHHRTPHKLCKAYPGSFSWHFGLNHLPCQLFKPPQLGASVRGVSSSTVLSAVWGRSSLQDSKWLPNFYFLQCLNPSFAVNMIVFWAEDLVRNIDHLEKKTPYLLINVPLICCLVSHNSAVQPPHQCSI